MSATLSAPSGAAYPPQSPEGDLRHKHAVIRFKRAVQFPRFSMAAGETWSFVVFGRMAHMLESIRSADRFEFAGGQGLSRDVEIVYEGPAGLALLRAEGMLGTPRGAKC
jgi:hypothetical protein